MLLVIRSRLVVLPTWSWDRNSNGGGWEVRYWGIEESDVTNFGRSSARLRGLEDVFYSPSSYSAKFVFDNADSLSVGRTTRIDSLELNLLRNGGKYQSRSGRYGNYEMYGGFRIFQFDEDFNFAANSAAAPTTLDYRLEAENLLTGFQVGCRNEVCLNDRLRVPKGVNVGIFNNRIDTRQRLFDENGTNGTIGSGVLRVTKSSESRELLWRLTRFHGTSPTSMLCNQPTLTAACFCTVSTMELNSVFKPLTSLLSRPITV